MKYSSWLRMCFALCLFQLAPLLHVGAACAAYPDKTIRIVVSNAPGGPTDALARVLAHEFAPLLGGTVIVENKPGAASNIGITSVARAEPDGYTLLVTTGAITVNPALSDKLSYDPLTDFSPICLIATSPVVIAAASTLGVASMGELIKLAKQQPDLLSYSSPGWGTASNFAAELLKFKSGLKMAHVPHTGAAPATQAVLSGAVQLTSNALDSVQPSIEAGHLKGLAVTSAKRWRGLPDVPSLMELGLAEAPIEFMVALFAPARTPTAIVTRLSELSRQVLQRPDVNARLNGLGLDIIAGTPDDLKNRIATEIVFYRELAAKTGLRQ